MPRTVRAVVKKRKPKGSKLNKRQTRQVKRIVGNNIESKVADSTILTTFDAAGTFIVLSKPAQGDAYNERSGDVIKAQRLTWRLQTTVADNTNIVRVIIFKWNLDNNITGPSTTAVLETLNVLAYVDYQALQQSKVQILHDRTYALSTEARPNMILTGSLYGKKLGKKKIGFNQGATTGIGHYYMMVISDSVASPHPGISGFFRLTFTDA